MEADWLFSIITLCWGNANKDILSRGVCSILKVYEVSSLYCWKHSTTPSHPSPWPFSSTFLSNVPEDSIAHCMGFCAPKCLLMNFDAEKFWSKGKANQPQKSTAFLILYSNLLFGFILCKLPWKPCSQLFWKPSLIQLLTINCSCTEVIHLFLNLQNVPHHIFTENPLHKMLSSFQLTCAYTPDIWAHNFVPSSLLEIKSCPINILPLK